MTPQKQPSGGQVRGKRKSMLKTGEIIRLTEWLRANDVNLKAKNATMDDALTKANADLDFKVSISNLRNIIREIQLDWKPRIIRTYKGRVSRLSALNGEIADSLVQVMTFLEMEIPPNVRAAAED